MPILRRDSQRVTHTTSFGAALLMGQSTPTVPPPEDHRHDAVFAGHEAALADTLSWLDKEAAFARSGPATLDCRGLNTTVVLHLSSTKQQPHIHTHVLVGPTVTGVDGRTYPVDWDALNQALVAASPLYMGALRHNLVESLAVTWTRDHHESKWQIAGIPDALLARWPDTTCAFPAIPQTLAAVRPC